MSQSRADIVNEWFRTRLGTGPLAQHTDGYNGNNRKNERVLHQRLPAAMPQIVARRKTGSRTALPAVAE